MKGTCIDCGGECHSTRCWSCYNKHRRKTKTKTKRSVIVSCDWCGEEIQRGKSAVNEHNFCNRPCYLAWRAAYPKAQYKHSNKIPRVTIECTQCGKEIKRKPQHVKEHNFCSHKCHNNWLSERREERLKWEEENPNHCQRCGTEINQSSTFCKPCVAYLNTPTRSKSDDPDWWERQLEIIRATRSKGEEHYNWHGGVSFEPYGDGFDNVLRAEVRDRDNYTCRLCNKSEEDNGEDLSVHHVDYSKDNHSLNNLVSLCRVCHTKTNHNRQKWKAYFQEMLKGSY